MDPAMRIITLFGLAAALGLMFLPRASYLQAQQHDNPGAKNPFASDPEAVKVGKDIFAQSCAACHGSGGGGGGRGPALNQGSFKRGGDDAALFGVVKNGIPGTPMPSLGLSADDTWRVVAYL